MVVVAVSDVGVAAVSVAYDAIVIDSNHEGKLVAPVETVGYLIGLADAVAVAVIRRHNNQGFFCGGSDWGYCYGACTIM